MRHYIIPLLACICLVIGSCSTPEKPVNKQWKPRTGSYSADSYAIDTLLMDDNWTDSLHLMIDNAIGVDFSYNRMSYEQAIGLYKRLLDESAE